MPVDQFGNVTRPGTPIPETGQGADAPQVNVPVDDIYSILNRMPFLDGRKSLLGNIPMNGYRARGAADAEAPQDYVTLAQVEALLNNIAGVPTGTIVAFSGTNIPPSWVQANGATLTRAAQPGLYAHAVASGNMAASEGTKTAGQYGPGNGSTTFTLPNLYADGGYFIRPISSGRGIGTVQADELKSHPHTATFAGNALPPHTHTGQYFKNSSGPGNKFGSGGWDFESMPSVSAGTPTGTVTVNSTGGTETRPKNIAYPILIKT